MILEVYTVVPYIRTFKLPAVKDVNMHLHVQSRKLVHECYGHCHVYASSTSGCAFVYFTERYYIEYSSTVSVFQTRSVRGQLL